jgi:hypothetical protein
MTKDLIEVGVVGPTLLRQAVVSLLAGQPELHIADPAHAQVWIEVGANPLSRALSGPIGPFILVGAPPDNPCTTDIGAYISFDESLAVLREAILVVASLTQQRAIAA